MGDIHQVVSLTERKDDKNEKREIMGIQIVLSQTEFDVDSVGYMKAEPKGFWERKKPAKREQPKKEPAKKEPTKKKEAPAEGAEE